jgi:uncharacterized protein (TIGR03437 family)
MKHIAFKLAFAQLLMIGAFAQESPSILIVDVENAVNYVYDVSEPSKLAQSPGPLTASQPANFSSWLSIMDVTAVNGSPVKGTLVMSTQFFRLTPTATTGQAIADIVRTGQASWSFEILKPDGGAIGSIFAVGLTGGPAPPGSPLTATAGNNAIIGGTGAFAGVRGTVNATPLPSSTTPPPSARLASQAEDPSMRRTHGGGRGRYVLQITAAAKPEVAGLSGGPMILHVDWTPVTANKPAQRGEALIVVAKGLGPTIPAVSPGSAFPREPFAVISSPVEVIVDGTSAPTINQVGLPGTTDMYHVAFRVPDAVRSGNVPLEISMAWIRSAAVTFPVQ